MNGADPVRRSKPYAPFAYSFGWSMFDPQRGRMNNEGFNSLAPYAPGASVVAVVGDSYVEALQVPTADSVQSRLTVLTGCPVYAFAAADSSAADYVGFTEWAARRYRLTSLVVVVNGDDLSESFGARPGHYSFASEGGVWSRRRTDWAPSGMLTLSRSALVRYVMQNLRIDPRQIFRGVRPAEPSAAPTDWMAPANLFLKDLMAASDLAPDRINLVFDGDREAIRLGRASQVTAEQAVLQTAARQQGFNVVNLDPVFRDDWRRNAARFDFKPVDGHWNSRGHALAAEAIARQLAPCGSRAPQGSSGS